jgi:hypothetical protein
LGQGGCWAAGKREKRKGEKWAAGERKWARGKGRKRGKGLGPRTRRVGLPAELLFSFSFLLFFSFSKQLNSI